MPSKKQVEKKIINGRLACNYGGWMYCNECGNTVGYLCYSTYSYFKYNFKCNCGCEGSFELIENKDSKSNSDMPLLIKKNRLTCPVDESPLFSIVNKNVSSYSFEVTCNKCMTSYKESNINT
ncbi:hypothetical protein LY28_01721 [Ruminiclostridium sufflavum DSM 19573]|uniref:Uncharacterized protein n=1 Tax=Ruminiclostridium sufflavum DSM 19573 TaxID=1121337 RepID=A0A318Y7A9_9FIRM|nr:hypothetical protein [Ruminiclostridium sufflavum]PYG88011.1 hypothetical protein LY28_01721 [Ruminiclostridium sufflavum DSM 19573]